LPVFLQLDLVVSQTEIFQLPVRCHPGPVTGFVKPDFLFVDKLSCKTFSGQFRPVVITSGDTASANAALADCAVWHRLPYARATLL
jgi:hypothetical protein